MKRQKTRSIIKYFFVISLLLLITSASTSAQSKQISSGLLIGGGAGTLDNDFVKHLSVNQIGKQFDDTYNYDLHLGYRFRIQQKHWLFWDLDALAGIKSIQKGTLLKFSDIYTQYETEKRHLNYYIALSPSANVRIYKELYAGLGVEPTCYFYQSKDKNMGFDLPATVKIGYNFRKFSLEGSAKFGLIRHSMENLLEKNRKKEFQLSIYIPFK